MNSAQRVVGENASDSGQLTAGERLFCKSIRLAIAASLESRLDFQVLLNGLGDAYIQIRRQSFDVDAAISLGFRPETLVPASSNKGKFPLSQRERDFLEDVDGFLDFATRNGLTFFTIVQVLFHDVNELISHKSSFDELDKNFVVPKVAGWATRNRESMIDDDELRGDERGE